METKNCLKLPGIKCYKGRMGRFLWLGVFCFIVAGVSAVCIVVRFFVARATDNVKKHEQKLQEEIDERTRYMLVTTHELKAPFSAIQSYVNMLLGGYAGALPEKVYEVLWKIKDRCALLTRMITEMLQLANISSVRGRRSEIVMKEEDIVWIIGTVIWRLTAKVSEKKVKFVWPQGQVYKITGNAEQLDILFDNILSNAINYSYPDTEIKIEIGQSEARLLVTVTNQGIGIKKEHLEKVFLEYFRSEKAVLINKNSTGLGLPIARHIMEIHGGRIWIESEEGAWVKVYMEFPGVRS